MKWKIANLIIKKAKDDPAFFHALVFTPEKIMPVLKKLIPENYLDNFSIDPSRVIGFIIGRDSGNCSCTSGTCEGTCGGRTCDVTCSNDSCGRTCDDSCGYTTNYERKFILTNSPFLNRLRF